MSIIPSSTPLLVLWPRKLKQTAVYGTEKSKSKKREWNTV